MVLRIIASSMGFDKLTRDQAGERSLGLFAISGRFNRKRLGQLYAEPKAPRETLLCEI